MSKIRFKAVLIVLAVMLLTCIIAPLLAPYSTIAGAVAPQQLADPDSQFIKVGSVSLHYKQYGDGDPVFILLHGTLANTYTWREVVAPLSKLGSVIVYDRPPFGLASRPMPGEWTDESPYSYKSQTDLLVSMMDAMEIEQAILVGNSMGGSIAAYTAQRYPERVQALILLAPGQTAHGVPAPVGALLATPQLRRVGPYFIQSQVEKFGEDLLVQSWHDSSKIETEDRDAYRVLLQLQNWDRALWELLIAARPFEAILDFETIAMPTLLITGDDDQVIGTETNMQLADKIPNADLVVIPNCGHVPQEECPTDMMRKITRWFAQQELE